MSDEAQTKLPSFRNPPVVETVLGVQFAPLDAFTNAHLGLFWARLQDRSAWSRLRDEWSNVVDAATIEPVIEAFGEGGRWGRLGPTLKLTQDPAARLQIRNAKSDRMVQVQNGRLHLNWLGLPGQPYPRYSQIRPQFDELLAGFEGFLSENRLGQMDPNLWEVTYVNHLPKGTVWERPSDWARLFSELPGLAPQTEDTQLESFSTEWHFQIPAQRGRLHIEVRHARVESSGPDVLRMVLTARGPARDKVSLADGLDLGRAVIVKMFAASTSADAQKFWQREG